MIIATNINPNLIILVQSLKKLRIAQYNLIFESRAHVIYKLQKLKLHIIKFELLTLISHPHRIIKFKFDNNSQF